jgi:hypothetical protein
MWLIVNTLVIHSIIQQMCLLTHFVLAEAKARAEKETKEQAQQETDRILKEAEAKVAAAGKF